MARPERHDVDYFPFYVKDGRTLFILEDKYGCAGTGFFTNMMRFLCRTPDHHFSIADESDRLFFFSKTKCDEVSGTAMLDIMAKTGKIYAPLWVSGRVIISPDLLGSLKDAYAKRNNPIITLQEVIEFYEEKGVSAAGNTEETELPAPETQQNGESGPGNPQTKLKKTKVKKSKKNYSSDSIEIRLAEKLHNLILKNDHKARSPDIQNWAHEIDLMIRVDKRDPDEIERVIDFCQSDPFWKSNILSTSKLREKFTQLKIKMEGRNDRPGRSQQGPIEKTRGIPENFAGRQYTGSDLESLPWNRN